MCRPGAFYKGLEKMKTNGSNGWMSELTLCCPAIAVSLSTFGLRSPEEIEQTYFFLWHHEGRRARNGLTMMGPDCVQWHGFYKIAERFYMELIPEAEHLMPNIGGEILARPERKWFRGNLSDGERKSINEYYQQRYRQKAM